MNVSTSPNLPPPSQFMARALLPQKQRDSPDNEAPPVPPPLLRTDTSTSTGLCDPEQSQINRKRNLNHLLQLRRRYAENAALSAI